MVVSDYSTPHDYYSNPARLTPHFNNIASAFALPLSPITSIDHSYTHNLPNHPPFKMPLWLIYHPPTTFTSPTSKSALADSITKIYSPHLPAFYVNVLFIPIEPCSFYVGGIARPSSSTTTNSSQPGADPATPFIRVHISNIARTLPSLEAKKRFLARVDQALKPYVEDMGYDWEYHVDETDRDLWKIQGLVPPPAGSDEEAMWKRENKAVVWEKL
ncbi:hypothetical protein K432DRAFT_380871 [Lepidopterella palustris CBS 459.81]|uniref:Tautomerase cis-CaaD-like domain-containing protein n=1 Tax=Lepidopterella palustris CBS 459.81 TaxID=1314670 RepID=A0A8E2EDA4_9PEZI|nr:hypothetical protein K432DRAFT_380871 [Lepidopterella palustris CBS 459.81]